MKDLVTQKVSDVLKYMDGLREFRDKVGEVGGVYLTGKTARDFPEIVALNDGLDRKTCKADV